MLKNINGEALSWIKVLVPAIGLLMAGLGAYYDLKTETALNKQGMEQEVRGYEVLLRNVNDRMNRFEDKLDRLSDYLQRRSGKSGASSTEKEREP